MLETLEYLAKAAQQLLQAIIISTQLQPVQDCTTVACALTEIVQQSPAPSQRLYSSRLRPHRDCTIVACALIDG